MSKSANPGALRTTVTFYQPSSEKDADGYRVSGETPLCTVRVKWVNKHGVDVLAMKQLGLAEAATLTLRYRADITPVCTLRKSGDNRPYDVISIDNVQDRRAFMEITVARKVQSI